MAKSFREFARTIVETLEALQVPYAIGGSVASSAYGAYRSTNDIDISIQLPMAETKRFVDAFTSLGYYVNFDAILDAFIWKTPFNVIDSESGLKVDFFSIEPTPLEQAIMERSRRVVYDRGTDLTAVLYSPEDVIIYKLKYFSEGKMPKHPRDILAMLEMHGTFIDFDYITQWATETGVLEFWNEILEEHHQRISKDKK